MAPPALIDAVAGLYPVIAALTPAERDWLGKALTAHHAADGTVLFDKRSPCTGFPFVLGGAIRVVKADASGRELVLYRVAAGDSCLLTSSCLVGKIDYAARGVVEGALSLALLPGAAFERLLAESDGFRRHVFRLFGERMALLMRLVEDVAFRRVDERLAALLLRRADPDDGVLLSSHQALADEIGSVREIVSRVLAEFARRGLVRTGRERIEILDRAALAHWTGADLKQAR